MLTQAAAVVGDRDPAMATRLAEMANELVAGPSDHDVRLRVLGRVEVVVGDTTRRVRGRPAQLLGLLSLRGRCTTEAAAVHLWPECPPARSRERLRTVLARTRRDVGPVVARNADTVQIPAGVRVDSWEFERLALRALDRPRGGHGPSARAALALYDERVAPDLQEHDWAVDAVRRLRGLALGLHDRLADEAEAADDSVEAVHQLLRALALEPTREHRALRAARLLAATGQEGRALDLLDATSERLGKAGLAPSAEVTRLTGYLQRRAGRCPTRQRP